MVCDINGLLLNSIIREFMRVVTGFCSEEVFISTGVCLNHLACSPISSGRRTASVCFRVMELTNQNAPFTQPITILPLHFMN
ncbi:hypothetical protein FKM82_011356 [Ascaphus truei]